MTPAQQKLSEIDAKVAEQARLLAQLKLWAQVQAQGVDIATVKSFGFNEKLLTPRQEIAARQAALRRKPDPVTGVIEEHNLGHFYTGKQLQNGHYTCTVYNYVWHHAGTKTVLSPMLRAV